MNAGDRVLVYQSPGSPLDHWIYATVLTPQPNGALVKIDHEGNPLHGETLFVPSAKIRVSADLVALAAETRVKAAAAADSTRKQELLRIAQQYDFQASAL